MAFLSTNRFRDSWAYRSQNGGFSKAAKEDFGASGGGGSRPTSAGMNRTATSETMETLNKTMSHLQFNSRPNTPTNNRNIRPTSASAGTSRGTTLNQNPNNRRGGGGGGGVDGGGVFKTTTRADLTTSTNDIQYFDDLAGNKYKDAWTARTSGANQLNGNGTSDFSNNRENSASNRQTLRIDPSTVTLSAKTTVPTPLSNKVPRFVETDKQVLRFYCHFFDKETQITHHPDLLKVKHPSTARLFSLLVYLNDFTIEIAEEKQANSGYRGGQFYKRNYLKKDDQSEITVQDLRIGGTLSLLGHDFFITDCDTFTRGYFRRTYDVILSDPEPRPDIKNPTIGAQNSTGLGMTERQIASGSTTQLKKTMGNKSQNFHEKREQINKTSKFLNYNGVLLNFMCVEVLSDTQSKGISDAMLGMGKKYCLTYSMCDDQIEVRMIRSNRSSTDDPTLLLRKCRMPINWRDHSDIRKELRYYTPEELITGNVIDCFGRQMLLLNCDQCTRKYYQDHYGITQNEVIVEDPEEITYQNSIPQLGDGYLAIGGEADTLHTVYGHPKPARDWQKANRNMGQIIRCRMKMLTEDRVDLRRVFMLTFHLEDDSVAVYEEKTKNSGCAGGQFLKRGVYTNGLPPDSTSPRPFIATDIYLGNVILLNGYEMQITEMDDLSVKFCEENSDEFPFFDTYEIIHKLMGKVLDLGLDLRHFIVEHYDPRNLGYLSRDDFVKCLDDLQLSQEMNDQELMTLMRRFKSILEGNLQLRRNNQSEAKYHFHEMCDLFSHATYVEKVGQHGNTQKGHLDRLLEDFRGRQTQWRRLYRMDHHSDGTHLTASILISLTQKAGMKLSKQSIKVIIENFALEHSEAQKVLAKLPKDNEMDEFDMANAKISESATALSRSRSRDADWIQQRRKQHGQSILRRGAVEAKRNDDEYNLEEIVISFHDFCDAMYVCDWVM